MSEVREFFRHCPNCGRRFHIRLVSKELVGDRKETEELRQMLSPSVLPGSRYGPQTSAIIVESEIPVTVDIKEFNYAYKCKHCGHEWSETRTEVDKEE